MGAVIELNRAFYPLPVFELPNEDEITTLSLYENTLAVGYLDGTIKVFSVTTEGSECSLNRKVHSSRVVKVQFSKSGTLYSLDENGGLAVFKSNYEISRLLKSAAFPTDKGNIAISTDGRLLATLSTKNKNALSIYSSQLDHLNTVVFSCDSQGSVSPIDHL